MSCAGGEDVLRPNRLERLTRWGAVAMLLFLIQALGAPRSAWAGCNHLVLSHSDRLLSIDQLSPLIIGAGAATVSDELPSDLMGERGSNRPAPCSGPGCSSRVPLPVPTAVSIPGGTDQWGTLSIPGVIPVASPFDHIADEPVAGSFRRETSIFHPPRV
jgi:hypothetical protein